MIENLEDAMMVMVDAMDLYERFTHDPDPESESITEDSIYSALRRAGASVLEITELKDIYIDKLRGIIHPTVDPKKLNR